MFRKALLYWEGLVIQAAPKRAYKNLSSSSQLNVWLVSLITLFISLTLIKFFSILIAFHYAFGVLLEMVVFAYLFCSWIRRYNKLFHHYQKRLSR